MQNYAIICFYVGCFTDFKRMGADFVEKLFAHQINKLVDSGRFSNENELQVYVNLLMSATAAGLMHVLLFASMLGLGVFPLVAINLVSILCYSFIFFLVRSRQAYFSAGILIAAEVIVYIPLTVYFIGMNTFVFMLFFVLVFMQWNVPYTTTRNLGILTAVIWVAVVATLTLGVYVPPVYPLVRQSQVLILSLLHINLTFIGFGAIIFAASLVRTMISASMAAQIKKYKAQATVDALTELSNRRSADLFVAELASNEATRSWCVAMLDIDDFKQVNDLLGHLAGDEVLRHLAQTLSSKLRRTDAIFRWGGEEFLVFLADVGLDTAANLLEKIRIHIAEHPVETSGASIPITVTIGLAKVNVKNIQASIDLCDQRLYDGKRNGKNQVVSR